MLLSSFEKKLFRYLFRNALAHISSTQPNPVVGAAVVKNQAIISTGFHEAYGDHHAEVNALNLAGSAAQGATLYVTLEPCTHFGKTPPCTDKIIESGIKEVVYAVDDPNPNVRAHSAKNILEAAGIQVRANVWPDEAKRTNAIFFKNQLSKKPFVTLKAGMSLDGKIALASGESKYITSPASLKQVHRLRAQHQAILIGINTVLKDNPTLNIRYTNKKRASPIKIILDSDLRTPPGAALFENGLVRPIIFCSPNSENSPQFKILSQQADIVPKTFDWNEILSYLFKKGICSLLIEGGQHIFTSAIQAKVVDQIKLFIAPKFLMGQDSLSLFSGQGVHSLEAAIPIFHIHTRPCGDDIIITGTLYAD